MTKSVLIYGSECTGKTFLTEQLALHFKTIHIPDVKRSYIAKNKYCFIYDDMYKMAELYHKEKLKAEKTIKPVYFSDSDALTMAIYSEEYFWKVNPDIEKIISKQNFDLILFTNIDIPWIYDPSRDYENNRKSLHNTFREELKKRNLNYTLIRGSYENRLAKSIDAVNKMLNERD